MKVPGLLLLLVLVFASAASGACALFDAAPAVPRERPPSVVRLPRKVFPAPGAPSCERVRRDGGADGVVADAGAAVALATSTGRSGEDAPVVYVADEDARSLLTLDVEKRRTIAATPLEGGPSQALVLRDGRVVVALRDRAALAVLEPTSDPAKPLERRCLVDTPAEPVALARTPDGTRILVASRWGHALTVYDATSMARVRTVDLPRDPAAVVASADGSKAFVAHAVGGRLSVVELEGDRGGEAHELRLDGNEWRGRFDSHIPHPPGAPPQLPPGPPSQDLLSLSELRVPAETGQAVRRVQRAGSQGFSLARMSDGRVLLPEVLVDTGGPGASGYGDSAVSTVMGNVAVLDAEGRTVEVPPLSSSFGMRDCLLPRASAFDEESGTLLVACLGIDTVIAYDARAKRPHDRIRAKWPVGEGPTSIAIDARNRRALVWSRFARSLAIVPLPLPRPRDRSRSEKAAVLPPVVTIAAAGASPIAPELELGRRLFHAAGTRRLAFDGRACASCHPDGRDDALTWSTPDGPRQTPMLLGRLDATAPYGWDGDRKDLASHFARTIQRLSGTGIPEAERDALFAYIQSLRPPAVPAMPDARARRGAELFRAEATGCASCHTGVDTSTDGVVHDVGTVAGSDRRKDFDTPSLRFVGRTAPFLHDGRYPTLQALLRGADREITMGHTAQLSDADLDALGAYLDSL